MDMGRLGDMLVVCSKICAMRLGCIQEWRNQRTFLCGSNLNLNQFNFDLPSRLSI